MSGDQNRENDTFFNFSSVFLRNLLYVNQQNLFPEYLYLVGETFTSRSPSDPDVSSGEIPQN